MDNTKNIAELTETQRLDQIISNRRTMLRVGGTALAVLAFASVLNAQPQSPTMTSLTLLSTSNTSRRSTTPSQCRE
jgi:hypothetical protein